MAKETKTCGCGAVKITKVRRPFTCTCTCCGVRLNQSGLCTACYVAKMAAQGWDAVRCQKISKKGR